MTLQEVIELNNETVAFVKRQQFQNASAMASRALNHHRELSRGDQEMMTSSVTSKSSGFIVACMLHGNNVDEPGSSSTEGFIYQSGIPLPSDATDMSSITSILIFNTALSHQLLAQEQQNKGGATHLNLLHKAKRLYELADLSCDMEEENLLFKFAVMNNTAVIHKAVGNVTKSRECLDYLLSLMMVFVDRGCSMQLRQLHGFWKNVNTFTESAPAA